MENKISAIIFFREIESLRPSMSFDNQKAHQCLWEYEEPCGGSGSGPVVGVVRRGNLIVMPLPVPTIFLSSLSF